MRVLLQRVRQGSVTVDGEIVGAVDRGYVALVGITHNDTEADADLLATKTVHLRVFEDEAGKMNRSILEVRGGILVVSQFTLYADVRKGRRPSFIDAAAPAHAAGLMNRYASKLVSEGVTRVEKGIFGAMMQVSIMNDGPVTLWLDTAELHTGNT